MRFLIVDHMYPAVTHAIYGRHPGLDRRAYAEQRLVIDDMLFGESVFEVSALRALGHEAWDSLVDIYPLQRAWAREHASPMHGRTRWGRSRRRGWIPWPRRHDDAWVIEGLLSQIRILRPDIVHIQAMDLLRPEWVRLLRGEARLIVGQLAADVPPGWDFSCYDLVVSSVPALVDRFRREAGDAEWLPLAFEPSLVTRVKVVDRDVPVSFVGSFSVSHPRRIEVLEAIARRAPVQIWTGDASAVNAGSPVRPTLQGPAWGRGMYEVLARSRITINNHARIAAGAVNNLRLYEGTGMGALLVTDTGTNLADLFEPEREVVTYRTPDEAAEKVAYYVDHPSEAAAVAQAGQARTLRDHTWPSTMARLVEIIQDRL
jgi:spore maturation protein CgeB